MNNPQNNRQRVLAIDLCSRGVGFVVMEGTERLVDWGVKRVRFGSMDAMLKQVTALVDLYRPDALVSENCTAYRSRRGDRAKALNMRLSVLAPTLNVRMHTYSSLAVKLAFAHIGGITKERIAAHIAQRFPALARHLPPHRKIWMSEDYRMSIFDAAAFALTHFDSESRWRSPN